MVILVRRQDPSLAALQYGWGRGRKVWVSERGREKRGRLKNTVGWGLVGPRCLVFTLTVSSLLSNNQSYLRLGADSRPISRRERGATEFGFYHVRREEREWWQHFHMVCVCVCVGRKIFFLGRSAATFSSNHTLYSLLHCHRWIQGRCFKADCCQLFYCWSQHHEY